MHTYLPTSLVRSQQSLFTISRPQGESILTCQLPWLGHTNLSSQYPDLWVPDLWWFVHLMSSLLLVLHIYREGERENRQWQKCSNKLNKSTSRSTKEKLSFISFGITNGRRIFIPPDVYIFFSLSLAKEFLNVLLFSGKLISHILLWMINCFLFIDWH